MRGKKSSAGLAAVLAIFGVSLLLGSRCAGSDPEYVIHSFHPQGERGDANGSEPYANLIFDASGTLYGTTLEGGAYGLGTVFELSPRVSGGWIETVLYSFAGSSSGGADGAYPRGSLIFDAAGNLFGVTAGGGTGKPGGLGTVYELSPAGGGAWRETVLHSFTGFPADGDTPLSGLVFDADGNLYGTTSHGGLYEYVKGSSGGTAFELSPAAQGVWNETIIHNFGSGADGGYPQAGLTLDASGNLYGTTVSGGSASCAPDGCGTVFELSPAGGGVWAEAVLHSFTNSGEAPFNPFGGVIFDATGNLYGTTASGGYGSGTVFELFPTAGGSWKLKVLHAFGHGTDGIAPEDSLLFDAAGDLYGTTPCGGAYGGCQSFSGTVFELSPEVGGAWSEKVLHSFGHGSDGSWPYAVLIFDAVGNLYGTTSAGGAYGGYGGTVFEIKP
jgi:uncharacterized repeat protein (TIGR03803 family)